MAGIILLFISAVFFPGIIIRVKSLASGRKGPSILQPIRDIRVLFKKDSVFSSTTSLIFQMAPTISLATILCLLFIIPVAHQNAVISFEGDFIFFAYLLALGKFFSIIGAMDTGSSFEGMGANREALYSMLIEPAFFILLATVAMFTGYTSFSEIMKNFYITENNYVIIFGIIGFYILIQIAMIENSRLPIDDPKTHLELTMVHEVMILDNCSFDKALIHITSFLKYSIYGAFISGLLIPDYWGIFMQIIMFLIIQVVFAAIIGLMESFRARNKMLKNAQYILTITAIAIVGFVVVLILTNKIIS